MTISDHILLMTASLLLGAAAQGCSGNDAASGNHAGEPSGITYPPKQYDSPDLSAATTITPAADRNATEAPATVQPSVRNDRWKQTLATMAGTLPKTARIGSNYIETTSAKVTGAASCELVLTADESTYNMSDDLRKQFETSAIAAGQALRNDKSFATIRITVVLHDKAHREIFKKNI